jgi:hypothetical protein
MRIASLALPLALLAGGVVTHEASAAGVSRSYVAGSYLVSIDGAPGVWVAKVSGGGATADVVTERAGQPGAYPKKHAGGVKYEDLAFAIPGPTEKPLHDWIKQTLASAQAVPKNGAVASLDGAFKEHSRIAWTSGFISDFSFPELDSSSREPAPLFVTITPQSTRLTQGAGATPPGAQAQRSKATATLASNFRLSIAGLEAVTPSVTHIDPMSVRFAQVPSSAGELRDYERTSGKVDVSNLVFTVAESRAEPLVRWHDDFVVKGNNGDAMEKTGSIELLSADLKTVLYKLTMKGIGILKYGPDKTSNEQIRRLRVECYVESVSLD